MNFMKKPKMSHIHTSSSLLTSLTSDKRMSDSSINQIKACRNFLNIFFDSNIFLLEIEIKWIY